MKYWVLVLVSVLLITSCFTQEKEKDNKKESKKKKKIDDYLVRYITNWNGYRLPTPVTVISLKDILEKIALYKRNVYCPFGENECDSEQYGLPEIVSQIVKNSVAEAELKKNETLNSNETLTEGTNGYKKEKGSDQNQKDAVRTQPFIIPYPGMDFSDVENVMTKILQFGSSIHNKSLRSALRALELILIMLFYITPGLAKAINENDFKMKNEKSYPYVSNWDRYNLPKPVPADVLKEILSKIAMYRRDEFCPFGINMCDPNEEILAQVISKIVKDSIIEYRNLHSNNGNDDIQGNNNMSDQVSQVLQKMDQINNEFDKNQAKQKLYYGIRYKHFTNKNSKMPRPFVKFNEIYYKGK